MDIHNQTPGEMANMGVTLLELLAGDQLTALTAAEKAEFIAELGTLPATLTSQNIAADALVSEKQAAVLERNITTDLLAVKLCRVRARLRSKGAPENQLVLCGFNYVSPVKKQKYVAQDPTDLRANGYSNGVNRLKFRGNNKSKTVTYEVWRREGDEGQWAIHATTTKQTFIEGGVTPGRYYEYRVRAIASQTESNFSNTAVVYGVL